MKSITFGILLFSLIISGCCAKPVVEDDTVISVYEINCWLNLMPGGNPSFHYSGTFGIDKKYSDKFNFSVVKVFYKNELIHHSQPVLQFYDEMISDSASIVRFHFYSQQGINVTETMMRTENVDFVLDFEFDGKSLEKKIFEVQVLRAY